MARRRDERSGKLMSENVWPAANGGSAHTSLLNSAERLRVVKCLLVILDITRGFYVVGKNDAGERKRAM